MDYRPTRIQVSKVYWTRAIRWRRNSAPFITGDAFADYADVVINPPRFRGSPPSLRDLRRASSIFVPSHDLHRFLEEYKGFISPRIIIAGNSDFEFHNHDLEIPKSARLLLLQNSFLVGDSRVRTIPIGIENFRFGVNGHPKEFQTNTQNPTRSILIGPYSNTHPIRNLVVAEFEKTQGPWTILKERHTPKQLGVISSSHMFTAAVRGNGVDTHRLWETLYRGRIPICETNDWLRNLEDLNLPILETNNWSPDEVRELINRFQGTAFDASRLAALWMPYWRKLMENSLG